MKTQAQEIETAIRWYKAVVHYLKTPKKVKIAIDFSKMGGEEDADTSIVKISAKNPFAC
jgi:hypothetical protein